MGFIFGLLGAFAGMYFMSGSHNFAGFMIGMVIGWLLHRVLQAQSAIKKLVDRVDDLEQRKASPAATPDITDSVPEVVARARSAAKKVDTPARVSLHQPEPVETLEPATIPEHVERPAATEKPEVEATPSVLDAIAQERTPVADAKMGMGSHAIEVAKRWLTTGNVPVKVGVIISFFGVSFLLKYAVENQVFSIPVSVRYLGVAAFAIALLSFGWRKREDNRAFALSIQGGGIGVLFLTVFAAFRLHGLLSPTVAFALLIFVTAAAGVLAIKQESRAFAILGTTGGFLAPLLVSTGSGDHVGLFSYYLILNCAVLGIAWFRAWRELNIIGFGFTFGVGTLWGYQYYVPELFTSTEPFLVLYFLFYTIIAVLFAMRAPPKLRGYVDGTLLFGTPTIAFALQTQLLGDTEYGLSISAAVVAAFYAAMAVWLRRTQEKNFDLLAKAFIAMAVAFATIAIPLALDDRWTAIAWAMEGAALVWVGVQQRTTLAKMTGSVLGFASGVEFLSYGWQHDLGIPVINGNYIGSALIAVSALYSSHMLLKDERAREWQRFASVGLLIWGLGWWFDAGLMEISDRVATDAKLMTAITFFGASFIAMNFAANRLQWNSLWQITLGFLPLAGGAGIIAYGWTDNLGIPVLNGNVLGGAMIAWMALYSARKLVTDERTDESLRRASVVLLGWGLLFWFGTGSMEIFDRVSGTNQLHALLLFGSLSLAAIAYAGKRFAWIGYQRVSLALLPALIVGAFAYLLEHEHFFKGLGVLGWLVAIAAHVWILRASAIEHKRALTLTHTAGAIFFIGLLAFEVSWQIDRLVTNDVWSVSAGLLVLAAGAYALLSRGQDNRWPFGEYFNAYYQSSLLLIVGYLVLVIGININNPGSPAPLPYIPLLNPFDVLSIVALALMYYGTQLQSKNDGRSLAGTPQLPLILSGTALFLSTVAVVRAVHHFTGVAWHSNALFASVGVQSSLSIYWAMLGLGGMLLGTRRENRNIWQAGAALMAVVVLKLFVTDLGNTGTVARIVSFLGVGVLLLVVGYFSPVPPKKVEATARRHH